MVSLDCFDTMAAGLYVGVLNDVMAKIRPRFEARFGRKEARHKLDALRTACSADMEMRGVLLVENNGEQ